MLRKAVAIAGLAWASPLFGQQSAPDPQSGPVQPETASPVPAAPADPKAQIAAIVEADWPQYDQGAKGYLTEAEFATWLTTLKTRSGSVDDAGKTAQWVQDSFKRCDANADNQIAPPELTAFLAAKVKPR